MTNNSELLSIVKQNLALGKYKIGDEMIIKGVDIDTFVADCISARNPQQDWLPIESAPRDGSWFLAIMDEGIIPYVTAWCDYDEIFFTFNNGYAKEEKFHNKSWEPTHFMPLPIPPKLNKE